MNKKGFTLIEILIVIVIIAILAAIMLPRLLPQTERAYVAEAINTLGTMTRAQNQLEGIRNDGVWLACTSNEQIENLLGINVEGITRFTFNCTTSACSAVRVGDSTKSITFTQDGEAECGTGYSSVKDPDDSTKTISCA